jgi:cation:H+ antiporter
MVLLSLLPMLLVILVSAMVFTNALEHLGEKLKISEGVTGSFFAAIGTALPESLIPVLAIFAGTQNTNLNQQIGVGAILGAPLMLSTLSMFLLALVVLKKRAATGHFAPERSGLKRDLDFFLGAFSLAAFALFIPHHTPLARALMSIALVILYFFYILLTFRASAQLVRDGHATQAHEPIWLGRLGLPENLFVILFQLALGLGLLVIGARGFIHGVQEASDVLAISPLLLSLIIIPIATELPEQINSFLWVRRHKDTLAFGNITGAMVLQGTLLPAIGITLTPWSPEIEVLTGITVTLLAVFWLRAMLSRGQLRVWHMGINGMLYFIYLIISLAR